MEKVVTYTDEVENSAYGYLEDYGDIFLPECKNSKESIFAVQCSDYQDDNTSYRTCQLVECAERMLGMWSCGWVSLSRRKIW